MTPALRRHVILTLGETMALLDPTADGPIVAGREFKLRVAGAESNFAIALTRLGMQARWISRVGRDPLGDVLYRTLDAEGLDLGHVRRADAPTGLFLKSRGDEGTTLLYYRRGSAASQLEPSDVPDAAFDDVSHVHLTGITMALSESACATVIDVARRAREREIPVTFDPNYRPSLWRSPEDARRVQRRALDYADWYLCGEAEGASIWGVHGAPALFDALDRVGVHRAVVRIGVKGALVRDAGAVLEAVPNRIERVLDEVGAGDAFAAGFVYGLLNGWDALDCARAGNVIAARALRGTGDWETLPYLDDVKDELAPTGKVAQ